ncbi:AMP-binding protein, partial [Staphylococcus aureus]|uniref:AMP-binding protein n=1 Tax=Staphylococcus aureus TaxID=1280 RepID=UPI0038B39D90
VNSSYQRADLEFVLRDSGARAIITDVEHTPLVEEVCRANGDLADMRIIEAISNGELVRYPTDALEAVIGGETLANLQYTSGTTGFPKA